MINSRLCNINWVINCFIEGPLVTGYLLVINVTCHKSFVQHCELFLWGHVVVTELNRGLPTICVEMFIHTFCITQFL